jgi:hypothetical protein
MPEFTLHRNFVLRTTKGHAINFRKGKPTYVPPMCVPDAVAIGAQAVDGDADVLGEEVAEPIPLTQPERDAKIREAIGDDGRPQRTQRLHWLGVAGHPAHELPDRV